MFEVFSVIPIWLQNFGREVQNTWPIFVAIAAFFGIARWIYKQYRNDFSEMKQEIMRELTPNGGTSIKDAVTRIEGNQQITKQSLQRINDLAEHAIDIGTENAVRLEAIISNSKLAYFEMDESRQITRVNSEYLQLFRITESEAKSSVVWELIHPKDRERVFTAAEHSFVNRHPLITIAHFRSKDSDQYQKMEIRSFPFFKKGSFLGFVGTIAVLPEGMPVSERMSNVEKLIREHITWEEGNDVNKHLDRLPENHEDYSNDN